MATRYLTRSLFTATKQSITSAVSRSYTTSVVLPNNSSFLFRLRPLVAASCLRRAAPVYSVRGLSSRPTTSSLNDPNPNWSNRPPKETILLDGCDFEHWLVVMEKPEGEPTRDEIIDSYIKTLAMVVGSEADARMKIYSVSTRHYFAFGALVSEELSYKLKDLPKVRWVLPDSYLDVKNKDYGACSAGNIKYFKGEMRFQFPCATSFRRYIHPGKQVHYEAGGGSFNVIRELLQDSANAMPAQRFNYVPGSFQDIRNDFGRRLPYQPNIETNADIVHIKLMRNNAFVTVTDSKGNKKAGISTGKLAAKGAKLTRYSAEAAAENMGREVRKMKTKSVVVKVNGYTFFRKKKDAILSFKDGFTNSRPEGNPIVFIEDTTRKPHNGCRLKKKRRI